ncbi:MAG: matrixin family metalloprotease [Pseudobdellovibrionaceae bacterium]
MRAIFSSKWFWNSFFSIWAMGLWFAGCAPQFWTQPEAQEECGFIQDFYSQRISWKGQLPVILYVDDSVPREYDEAINNSAKTWNEATGRESLVIKRQTGYLDGVPRKDGINGIYFLSTWDSEKKSEQGRTSLYWVGDQIREADVRINLESFRYYVTSSADNNAVNIQALILHEMGHVLGLKHNDVGSSVMATFLPAQQDRVKLASMDKDSLKCEY